MCSGPFGSDITEPGYGHGWTCGCKTPRSREVSSSAVGGARIDRSAPLLGVRTLGISLAAWDELTVTCVVSWGLREAAVAELVEGQTDTELVASMLEVDRTGIDAPFGWPHRLVRTVSGHGFPEAATDGVEEGWVDQFRYRETDRAMSERLMAERRIRLRPASALADRAALATIRCMRLQTMYGKRCGAPFDRLGDEGAVVEVEPSGALASWGLGYRGYRARSGHPAARTAQLKRGEIVAGMEQLGKPWLRLGAVSQTLIQSDRALDALVSSLVARAAAKRGTALPRHDQQLVARDEGWIHLPEPWTFGDLVT